MTEVELAYLAGIVDGEGTISLRTVSNQAARRRWSWRLTVLVTNNDFALLDWIAQTTGKGWISKSVRYRGKTNPIGTWHESEPQRLIVLLENLMPYLIVKKPQAELVLAAARILGSLSHHRSTKEYMAEFAAASERLMPITAKLEILNDRGRKWRDDEAKPPSRSYLTDEGRARLSDAQYRRWAAWREGRGPHPHHRKPA